MPYADPEKQKQFFRDYYRKNKVKSQAYGKARRADPSQRAKMLAANKEHWYKTNYGLSVAERDALLAAQNGRCALCDKEIVFDVTSRGKRAHVDHCHETGKVRGVLCAHCNQALGQLGDSKAGLQKAVDYLSRADLESEP